MTGIQNDTEAVKQFRAMLTNQSNYFNDEPFPKNESNEEAHKRCSNTEDAKRHCPKRWEAAEKWWAAARMVNAIIDRSPFTYNFESYNFVERTKPLSPQLERAPLFFSKLFIHPLITSTQ